MHNVKILIIMIIYVRGMHVQNWGDGLTLKWFSLNDSYHHAGTSGKSKTTVCQQKILQL